MLSWRGRRWGALWCRVDASISFSLQIFSFHLTPASHRPRPAGLTPGTAPSPRRLIQTTPGFIIHCQSCSLPMPSSCAAWPRPPHGEVRLVPTRDLTVVSANANRHHISALRRGKACVALSSPCNCGPQLMNSEAIRPYPGLALRAADSRASHFDILWGPEVADAMRLMKDMFKADDFHRLDEGHGNRSLLVIFDDATLIHLNPSRRDICR